MKGGGIRLGADAPVTFATVSASDHRQGLQQLDPEKLRGCKDATSEIVQDEVIGLNLTAPRANLSITALEQQQSGHQLRFRRLIVISGKLAHVKADLILPSGNDPITGSATVSHSSIWPRSAPMRSLFRPLLLLALFTDSLPPNSPSRPAAISAASILISSPRATFPFNCWPARRCMCAICARWAIMTALLGICR